MAAPTESLKVVAPWEITGLDPAKAGYVFTRMRVAETLVDVADDGSLRGALATRWTVSKDALQWRFTLRSGVKFHDGTACDSAAVVRSLELALQQPGLLRTAGIQKISADGTDVVIQLAKPFGALPAYLAHSSAQILAPAAYAADGSVKRIVATGPYQVASLQAPQKMALERFAAYWGSAPAIAQAQYLAVSRAETRAMLAESGQADLVFSHDPAALERLRRNANLTLLSQPVPRTIYIKVNAHHPLLKDVRVRQALSMALDRAGIGAAVLRDPKAAATQLFPPFMAEWHVPGLAPLQRNAAQARQLLQAAGWVQGADGMFSANGQAVRLTMRTFSDRPELPAIATAIQAQLREIGVALEVRVGNSSDIPAGHQDGSLELALLARNYALVPDPVGTLLQDFGPTGGDWGAMGWRSAQVDDVLGQLSRSSEVQRRSALRGSFSTIVQADLPLIPVVWYQLTATASKRLQGASLDPLERDYRIDRLRWQR
ncbi:ABC transporter substrate-binding protein [Curvibacter sp. CHRR-16]|nr:ABC transporter substrate-binding protein [Curvibacter sp. CHRR-16]